MVGAAPSGLELAAARVPGPDAEPAPIATPVAIPPVAIPPVTAALVDPPVALPPVALEAAPVVVDAAVTAPMAAIPAPQASAQRARWEALADALDLDDEPDASVPPPTMIIRPRRAQTDPALPIAGFGSSPGTPVPGTPVPGTPVPGTPVPTGPRTPDPWELPPPVREPTLIIAEPGPGSAATASATRTPPVASLEPLAVARAAAIERAFDRSAAAGAVSATHLAVDGIPELGETSELDLTERHADGRWISAPSVRPVTDHGELDRDDALGDDLDDLSVDGPADLADVSGSHPVVAPRAPVEPPPPSGGGFARELREKMSLMAERLFHGKAQSAPAQVAVGPAHDHHTEIDLAAIGEAPHVPVATQVFDQVGDTFSTPDQVVSTQVGHERTGESGALVRGECDAATLIARLATAGFTGRLVVRRGPVEKSVAFDAGRPVFASSNVDTDRMGQLLVREGKITAEQYGRADAAVRETGRRMGEILVDRGYLKRRELLPAVRRHVEDILYSIFAWTEGDYRIVAGDGAPAERIRVSRDPSALVLEGVRRKFDRATLEHLIGAPATVIEVIDRDRLAAVIGAAELAAEERAALTAFDGKVDLATAARQAGAPLHVAYALAWALVVLGVATAHRAAGPVEDDGPGMVGETDLAIDRERVRARHALVADADYFALLGVRKDATGFEIRRAYEAARKDFAAETFPPDLRGELAGELAEIALVLDEAHQVLQDDRLRADYLAHLVD
jgi:hypothetical protein